MYMCVAGMSMLCWCVVSVCWVVPCSVGVCGPCVGSVFWVLGPSVPWSAGVCWDCGFHLGGRARVLCAACFPNPRARQSRAPRDRVIVFLR